MALTDAQRQAALRERRAIERARDKTKANLAENLPKAVRFAADKGNELALQCMAPTDEEILRNIEDAFVRGIFQQQGAQGGTGSGSAFPTL